MRANTSAEATKAAWVQKLLEDSRFEQAVRDCSLKDAASCAVDALQALCQRQIEAQQRALGRANSSLSPSHGTRNASGNGSNLTMQQFLFQPEDRVRLKLSCSSVYPQIQGDMYVLKVEAYDTNTIVKVRTLDGREEVVDFNQLELVKRVQRNEKGRVGSQVGRKSATKDTVKRVAKDLTDFENRVSWNLVHESFRADRVPWRAKCKAADTPAALGICIRELLAVLTVSRDLPNVTTHVSDSTFLQAIDDIVRGNPTVVDPANELSKHWELIKVDLLHWMDIKDNKHSKKNVHTHAHLSRCFQAHEDCSSIGPCAYRQAPVAHILQTPSERSQLMSVYEAELKFVQEKLLLEGNPNASMEDWMAGVTYGESGLGGSYGGMPRLGRTTIEGVMDNILDGSYPTCDTEDDDGSEATDMAESDEVHLKCGHIDEQESKVNLKRGASCRSLPDPKRHQGDGGNGNGNESSSAGAMGDERHSEGDEIGVTAGVTCSERPSAEENADME